MNITKRKILLILLVMGLVIFLACPAPIVYKLTVNITPYNSGEVEVRVDDQLLEGESGEYEIQENKEVTLTAIPGEGYDAVSWSGGITGYELTQTLTITEETTVTAEFLDLPDSFTLTLNTHNEGSVQVEADSQTVTGTPVDDNTTEYTIDSLADVTLTGTPEGSSTTMIWSGDDVSETGTVQNFLMDSDKEVDAIFLTTTDTYDLTLTISGNGEVSVKTWGIEITPTGDVYSIYQNADVTLEASSTDTDYKVEWTGDITDNGYLFNKIIMDADKAITATFTTTTDVYDEFLLTRYVDGNTYVAMSQSASPTDIAIFKDGLLFGNTLSLPADFNDFAQSFQYDIAVSSDGNTAYLSGSYKDTSNDWHAGWWDTTSGSFTEEAYDTSGFLHMHSLVSTDDYVIRTGTFDYEVYVGGNLVTLSIPVGGAIKGVGNMVSDGVDIYIAGSYEDSSGIYHPIIWNSDGTIDIDVDYITVGTDYVDFIGWATLYENAFAISDDGSYKFVVNKMERSDGDYDTILIEKDSTGTHTLTVLEGGFSSFNDAPFSYDGVYIGTVFYIAGSKKNETLGESMPVYWTVETDGTITQYDYPTDDNTEFPGYPDDDYDRIYGIGFLEQAVHVDLKNSGYFDGLNYIDEFKW